MGLFRKKQEEAPEQGIYVGEAMEGMLAHTGSIDGGGEEWFEVAGTDYYQDNLKQIRDSFPDKEALEAGCLALVALEPDNEYDPDAIVVTIAGLKVGHISRDDQDFVAEKIEDVAYFKGRASYVRAQFTGGGRFAIGVELDIGE